MNRKQGKRINDMIKRNTLKRKKILEFNKFLGYFRKKEFSRDFLVLEESICFEIKTLNDLHDLRKELMSKLGTWTDELKNISSWYSDLNKDYNITFIWCGKIVPIRIDLDVLYKKMPEELKSMKEGCGFEETVTPYEKGENRVLTYRCKV